MVPGVQVSYCIINFIMQLKKLTKVSNARTNTNGENQEQLGTAMDSFGQRGTTNENYAIIIIHLVDIFFPRVLVAHQYIKFNL